LLESFDAGDGVTEAGAADRGGKFRIGPAQLYTYRDALPLLFLGLTLFSASLPACLPSSIKRLGNPKGEKKGRNIIFMPRSIFGFLFQNMTPYPFYYLSARASGPLAARHGPATSESADQ
jgi:hypothetical protein